MKASCEPVNLRRLLALVAQHPRLPCRKMTSRKPSACRRRRCSTQAQLCSAAGRSRAARRRRASASTILRLQRALAPKSRRTAKRLQPSMRELALHALTRRRRANRSGRRHRRITHGKRGQSSARRAIAARTRRSSDHERACAIVVSRAKRVLVAQIESNRAR